MNSKGATIIMYGVVIMFLLSNGSSKTEDGTRDWGLVVRALSMHLFGGIWTLGVWVRKQWNALSIA